MKENVDYFSEAMMDQRGTSATVQTLIEQYGDPSVSDHKDPYFDFIGDDVILAEGLEHNVGRTDSTQSETLQ